MPRVIIRPKARRDINSILVYYIATAGVEVAKRFRKAATETFLELAKAPFVGSPRKVRKAGFHGVRMWHVRGFESYLIFYIPHTDALAGERVIHAAQDY